MRNAWVVRGSIILLLFIVACQDEGQRQIRMPIPRDEANSTLSLINTTVFSTNESNETNATRDEIRIRRLSDEEIAQRESNTEEYEYLRERRYSTTIDLTQINAYNCKTTIEDIKKELRRLADDIHELDKEKNRKRAEADRAKIAYDEALASGDEFMIRTTRFDYNDAENEYDDAKKEAREAHDDYNQVERTLRTLEIECPQMRKDAGLRK